MKPESSIPTPKQERTQQIIAEFCSDVPAARDWLFELFNIAMTWDHIVDGDEVDADMADMVLEAVLTKWPHNPFFQKFRDVLVPVMVNCISAWRSSNKQECPKIKALDVFTEPVGVVCFVLHGHAGVARWMPEYRRLMAEICEEDDAKDGGKL